MSGVPVPSQYDTVTLSRRSKVHTYDLKEHTYSYRRSHIDKFSEHTRPRVHCAILTASNPIPTQTPWFFPTQLRPPEARMDTFELYNLRVEVICPPGKQILCGAKEGDYFELRGEMLYLPPGQGMSIYSLASVLPLLAAKQRNTHANDWMTTDAEIACPDPHCASMLRIVRMEKRAFRHSETTDVPLELEEK